MPTPPKLSGRRGLGDYLAPPTEVKHKQAYYADINLTENYPGPPPTPGNSVFAAANTEFWDDCLPALSNEHLDFVLASEHPPKRQCQFAKLPDSQQHAHQGTSHSELTRLSTRPYALRTSDPSDFASTWENSIVPLLTELLKKHCECDFAVDVHNFPEVSGEAVPRVIYITLTAGDAAADDEAFEQTIRTELGSVVPERFGPIYLKFRRGGGLRKSNDKWWGSATGGKRDEVCEPKNVTFRPTPVPGMSIGPKEGHDAASLGGFLRVGQITYAMSALHGFVDSIRGCQLQVVHPAEPDLRAIVPSDPAAKQYDIGSVAINPKPGTFRESLTFAGTNFPEREVEMDWCLIGPVSNGKNVLSVPSFREDRCIAIESMAPVEGNTEVYAIARTSGYSLGFVSDVPGVQRSGGRMRREWTVRQYSPSQHPQSYLGAPWQSLKQWVTSGIGVAGDSGAWLIRRSDNAVIGLIWGRNHDRGNPVERVRLTYFTPMVDVVADVTEKADGKTVSLPVYSPADLTRETLACRREDAVPVDPSSDPWNTYARGPIREHRRDQENLIASRFAGERVPTSGTVLDRRNGVEASPPARPSMVRSSQPRQLEGSPTPNSPPVAESHSDSECSLSTLRSQDKLLLGLQLPELSTSSSVGSDSSIVDEGSEAGSRGHGVLIVGDELDGEDMEPIRSKASYAQKNSGLPKVDQMHAHVAWCGIPQLTPD